MSMPTTVGLLLLALVHQSLIGHCCLGHHGSTSGDDGSSSFHFPAVLTFGDSILDTGNNNVLPTIAKCNFPPYGKDFVSHRPTGRFSNGRVPSDMIASVLGIKDFLPPFLTTTRSDELLTGVSFASGGTGYDPLTASTLSILSMRDQLELFKQYKLKLANVAGEKRAASVISDSLYVVCGGSNDVVNTYFGSPLSPRRITFNTSSYLDFLVRSASAFVKGLHSLGARRIGVIGLPPLGCLPSQRTFAGGKRRECVDSYNEAAAMFNQKLSTELVKLRTTLPGIKLLFLDIYDSLLDLVLVPAAFGFEESSKGCCGTGEYELSILCNAATSTTCSDDSKYVFWDSFHPTEKAYQVLVKYVNDVYIPLLR